MKEYLFLGILEMNDLVLALDFKFMETHRPVEREYLSVEHSQ